MGSKRKFYAVAKGRKPGIYTAWAGEEGAEAQVKGFQEAMYKSFPSRSAAQAWLRNPSIESPPEEQLLFAISETKPRHQKPDELFLPPEEALQAGKVVVFTDGSCIKNPGPGGYGVILKYGRNRKELAQGFRMTTNNRMELTACIIGLQALTHPSSVVLYSDSSYVVQGIQRGWAQNWQRNGWKKSDHKPVENADLWARLLEACQRHQVTFYWVKGHANIPENERCDQLAIQAASTKDLQEDTGYQE